MSYTYDLFLEDGDLLDLVNLNSILVGRDSIVEENYFDSMSNITDELITESDMMIDIYDTKRFMIEQDTNIFMTLGYEAIQEGALSKIWEGIKNIIKKIKELITKFINFITGKRKKENSEESPEFKNFEQSADKKSNDADKNIQETVKTLMLIEKEIRKNPDAPVLRPAAPIDNNDEGPDKKEKPTGNEEKPSATDNKTNTIDNNKGTDKEEEKPTGNEEKPSATDNKTNTIDKNLQMIQELKNRLDKLMTEKKYIPMQISDKNIVKKYKESIYDIPEVIITKNVIHELFSILKNPSELEKFSDNDDNLSEVLKKNGYDNAAKYISNFKVKNIREKPKDADSFEDYIIIYSEEKDKVNRQEYFNTYYPKIKDTFLGYKENSFKYLDILKKDYKELSTIEKEVDEISKRSQNNSSTKTADKIINICLRLISSLSNLYRGRIGMLNSIEKAYTIHTNNLTMAMKDTSEIDKLNKNIKKMEKMLKTM